MERQQQYKVIVSRQAQYSIWPDNIEPPLGWTEAEARGNLLACLDYIADVWTGREVGDKEGQFMVIADADNILSVTMAGEEHPSGWHHVHGPCSLEECLTHINDVWRGQGPLPVQLRSKSSSSGEE